LWELINQKEIASTKAKLNGLQRIGSKSDSDCSYYGPYSDAETNNNTIRLKPLEILQPEMLLNSLLII